MKLLFLILIINIIIIVEGQNYTRFLYKDGCLNNNRYIFTDIGTCYNYCDSEKGCINTSIITNYYYDDITEVQSYSVSIYPIDKCKQQVIKTYSFTCNPTSFSPVENGLNVQCIPPNVNLFNSFRVDTEETSCTSNFSINECKQLCNNSGRYYKFNVQNEFKNQYDLNIYNDQNCQIQVSNIPIICSSYKSFKANGYDILCSGFIPTTNSNNDDEDNDTDSSSHNICTGSGGNSSNNNGSNDLSSSSSSNNDSSSSKSGSGGNISSSSSDSVNNSSINSISLLVILISIIFNLIN